MRIFTVTCDDRPAGMVSAADKSEAIAMILDIAEARNLLGVMAAPRRFAARQPTEAEMAEWQRQDALSFIIDTPMAA